MLLDIIPFIIINKRNDTVEEYENHIQCFF